MESLYQNFDDPTTIMMTTTAHSSMTGEPQKDLLVTIQSPQSKNVMKFSPNATAALIDFQRNLDLLGKTPIPGIGAMLRQVVKSVQVRVSLLSQYSDSNMNPTCT